jgi:hypothetical protein
MDKESAVKLICFTVLLSLKNGVIKRIIPNSKYDAFLNRAFLKTFVNPFPKTG